MKIGFDPRMHPTDKSYATRLKELLRHFAPGNDYTCDVSQLHECDLYHGLRPPRRVRQGAPKHVAVLFDLNFLRYPDMWPRMQRWRLVRTFRAGCRVSDCVLTVRAEYKRELTARLHLDERKIRVLPALGLLARSGREPACREESVRRKYMLPNSFLLMLGTNDPDHHLKAVVDAMLTGRAGFNLVVCGRRTAYADRLLAYVRENHLATKISFLYEPDGADLAALCSMASGLLYLPGRDASPLPVVSGLRHGLPMLLSDVPLNRETAGDAALYVDPGSVEAVTEGLDRLLEDEDLRRKLAVKASERAGLYSDETLARELEELYATF